MENKRVEVLVGDYEGYLGNIVFVYHGWNFDQYTIELDNGEEIICYHDEIKELML